MHPSELSHRADHSKLLDKPAQGVEAVLSLAFDTTRAGDEVERILHGRSWLGHSAHPAITDLPVGALTTVVALDALDAIDGTGRYSAGADAAIAIGLVGAVAAAVTGATDWRRTQDRRVKRTGVLHAMLNTAGASLYALSLVQRRRKRRSRGRALAAVRLVVLTAGAYLGGHMTYNLGSGVRRE
jgi:uncharacterized membrane protein